MLAWSLLFSSYPPSGRLRTKRRTSSAIPIPGSARRSRRNEPLASLTFATISRSRFRSTRRHGSPAGKSSRSRSAMPARLSASTSTRTVRPSAADSGGRRADRRAPGQRPPRPARVRASRREQPRHDRFRRGRRAAQPQRRFPLHDFRPGPRARSVPLLRPAGSQGALDAGARRAGRMGNARQRRRDVDATSRDGRTRLTFAETQPIPTYLFAFAAGRFSVERAERDGRDDADAASRNRREEGRQEPRRDLRPARGRARLAGAVHGHPLSVRQVRFPARAGVSVRRHGAPGRHLLQRRRPDARRVGDAESSSSSAPASSRTKRRTCGSAIS